MGQTQSYLTAETAVTAAVLVGAVGFGYAQMNWSSSTMNEKAAEGSTAKKGKAKAKSKPKDSSRTEVGPKVAESTGNAGLPGEFEPDAPTLGGDETSTSKGKRKKKSKKGAAKKAVTTSEADEPPAGVPISTVKTDTMPGAVTTTEDESGPAPKKKAKSKSKKAKGKQADSSLTTKTVTDDAETDGDWTRVESAGTTSKKTKVEEPVESQDETPDVVEPVEEKRQTNKKTLAEKLLPKPRKTGVDDMTETPDYPTLSRVMRVKPAADEKPAQGFEWGDYEDVDVSSSSQSHPQNSSSTAEEEDGDDDDGWGFVPVKTRSKNASTPGSQSQTSSAQPKQAQTQKQRQNAARRESQKAAKAAQEAERLATLAQHKRTVERERMKEQLAGGGKGSKMSGGMKASVDESGRLVWD